MTAELEGRTGSDRRLLTLLAAWLSLALLALQAPAPAPAALSAPTAIGDAPSLAIAPRVAVADLRDTSGFTGIRQASSLEDRPGFDDPVAVGAGAALQPIFAAFQLDVRAEAALRQRPSHGFRARAPPPIA